MVNRKYRGISKAMTAIIVVIIIAIVAVAGGYEYHISTLPKKPTTPALSGSITVVAQAGENDVALAQIAKNFEQLHPGVTVNIVSYRLAMH